MQKLAIVTSLALTLATATPAFANTTNVVNSGGSTQVNSNEVQNTSVNVVNTNVATVSQEMNAVNNTGGNVSTGNIGATPCNPCGITGGSSIVTGNATTDNHMDVDANSNVTVVDVDGNNGGMNQTDVVNTGGNLAVNTAAVSNTAVNVANTNVAFVQQEANVVNNTGNNVSANNVGAANILTGNAAASNTMGVNVNENATAVNISGSQMPYLGGCDLCGPCYASNCTSVVNSGQNAAVNTASVTNTAVNVWNLNTLFSNQGLNAVNNTGNNVGANNIYGANIVTGGAGTTNGMMVEGNSNVTAVSLDESMPMGVNDLVAVNSGASAVFNAAAVSNTALNTLNTNLLFAGQTVLNTSNSGSNVALSNIGGGLTWTGVAGTASNTAAGGNSNATSIGGGAGALITLLALMSL